MGLLPSSEFPGVGTWDGAFCKVEMASKNGKTAYKGHCITNPNKPDFIHTFPQVGMKITKGLSCHHLVIFSIQRKSHSF